MRFCCDLGGACKVQAAVEVLWRIISISNKQTKKKQSSSSSSARCDCGATIDSQPCCCHPVVKPLPAVDDIKTPARWISETWCCEKSRPSKNDSENDSEQKQHARRRRRRRRRRRHVMMMMGERANESAISVKVDRAAACNLMLKAALAACCGWWLERLVGAVNVCRALQIHG